MLASKMHEKLKSNSELIFDQFLSFLIEFWHPEALILANSQREIAVFEFLLYAIFCTIFIDFWYYMGSKIIQKSIKNRLKFEVQVRVPLGIDFSSILLGFEKQVGKENRAKINQKSIQKGI